jgi:hypothetical protein
MKPITAILATMLLLSVQGCTGDTSDCATVGDELVCPEDVSAAQSAVATPPPCMQDPYGNCIPDDWGGGTFYYCMKTASCRYCGSCGGSVSTSSCRHSCEMCAACLGV